MSGSAAWARAERAVALLSSGGAGLGGLWLRARPGPARDAVLAALGARRIPPDADAEALDGGVDLAATLAAGRVVRRAGLLAEGGLLCLPMAERCAPALAARLGQALDAGGLALVALDEAAGEDEGLPPALADRLGLFVDLDGVALADMTPLAARPVVAPAPLPDGAWREIADVSARLGIASLRAPIFCARAASLLAALAGRSVPDEAAMVAAVELTLAHRGDLPPEAEEAAPPPPEPEGERGEDDGNDEAGGLPAEMLVEAARAALPADLLARLAAGRLARARAAGRGTGAAIRSNRRGRPLPSRPGRIDGAARIDVAATLRAAVPWQKLRTGGGGDGLLRLRPEDVRVRRYEQKSDRLLIFAVDASGSQAMARLAEAKGAIEILLSQAYARRDHVALIGFRGTGAELLLPPTRSLVRTKKRLAALPGGGGTPLAAGLRAGLDLARQVQGRGFTPSLALLTDGRANIDLAGRADRARAGTEAHDVARAIGAICPGGIVIDTGRRPAPDLREIARAMAAEYLPLPRADAGGLSRAVAPALAG